MRFTYITLVDLFVRILHAAPARANCTCSAAVTQFVNEFLVASSELHVSFEIFGEVFSGVFGWHVRNTIEV